MAIAEITATCRTCGKVFRHRHKCYNRSQANEYEAWATANIDQCPGCWADEERERKRAAAEKAAAPLLETYPLPVIEGASEKQIAYASSLRTRWFEHEENRELYETYCTFAATPAAELPEKVLLHFRSVQPEATNDQIKAAMLENWRKRFGKTAEDAILVATCDSARKLIDALR